MLEILRDAESQSIIDADSMSIIEGAMQVIDMRVDEIMIPRSQMITVKASQEPICSSTSSMVIRPAVPPYSSTTIAM